MLHAGWVHTDARLDAEFRYWLELLSADAAHGTSLFARMLPLMAFGPGYWARTDATAHEELVGALSGMIAPSTARQTAADRTVDLRPLLGRITAPTLVPAGAHDRIIAPEQQQALPAGIPKARYAEIDAGHGAPAEDPAGFAARIAAFLDEQPTTPRSPRLSADTVHGSGITASRGLSAGRRTPPRRRRAAGRGGYRSRRPPSAGCVRRRSRAGRRSAGRAGPGG